MAETIEDIILDHDKRGMLALRPHVPADFCGQAAQYVLDHPGHTVIVTGFYVIMAGKPETDGPPGAIAIGRALQALGHRVSYVTDEYTAPVLRAWAEGADVIEFPITGVAESKQHAAQMLQDLQPSLLISIERCGRNCQRCVPEHAGAGHQPADGSARLPVRPRSPLCGNRRRRE